MAHEDTLRRVIGIMQGLSTGLPPPSSSHVLPPPSLNIPPLRLTKSTSSFQSEMLQSGLLPQIYKVASSKAMELETVYQESYRQICHRLVSLPRHKRESSITETVHNLRLTFETLYEQKDLSRILADALKTKTYFTRRSEECPFSGTKQRTVFNHAYTPFLENYFECNAYPSARDRLFLARKTMMTARQIEVWFQNHRNRAKKNGKALRKSMARDIGNISFDSLVYEPADDNMVPGAEELSSEEFLDKESEIPPQTQVPEDILSPSAPPHAFPTRYPPVGVEDPFAIGDRLARFPSPSWRRKPTITQVQYPSISIDELVICFASKLNLHENASGYHKERKSRAPWYTATVTVPSIAPHPALIPTQTIHPHILPSFSAPAITSLPTQIVTLGPISGSPPSASLTHVKASLRKMAPLPRRHPSSLPRPCISSARVPSSSSLSSSSSSRSSSLSSATSITPVTPPLSPTCQAVLPGQEIFQALGEYLMTSDGLLNQIESRHLDFSISKTMAKRIPRITPSYGTSSLISDPISNYLEVQS